MILLSFRMSIHSQAENLLSIKRISGCVSIHLTIFQKTLKLFGAKLIKFGRNNML